jgi:TetR/AcrR family transcriptional regulator, cholesterol catabolism regulator
MKAKSAIPAEMASGKLRDIYIAAAKVILDQGYHATSMDDIARSAGLTKPGLYYYVESKEQLLYDIMNYTLDLYKQKVLEPARAVTDLEERLRVMFVNHAESIVEDGQMLTIVTEEPAGLTPEHRQAITGRKRTYMNFVRETFRQLQEQGRLQEGLDVTVAAFGMQGMIMWLAYWFRPGGRFTARQVAEQHCKMLLDGLLRPK